MDPQRRNHHPRHPVDPDSSTRVNARYNARIVDVSLTGMQLESRSALSPGASCRVTIPGTVEPLVLQATVRWCRAIPGGRSADQPTLLFRAGVQFETVGEDRLERLRSAVAGLAAEDDLELEELTA